MRSVRLHVKVPSVSPLSPAKQLSAFINRFEPRVAANGRTALPILRKRLPALSELVYGNYNALAVGFGPSDKSSEAIFSVTVYPRWVSLFFLQGAWLPDPDKVLRGSGTTVRHIVLDPPQLINSPSVHALISLALKSAKRRLNPGVRGKLIIKSISAKQRPRRAVQQRIRAVRDALSGRAAGAKKVCARGAYLFAAPRPLNASVRPHLERWRNIHESRTI